MLASIKTQIMIMRKGKEYKAAFIGTFLYSSLAFIYALIIYAGKDLSLVKDANQMVCFSEANVWWLPFCILWPFLIVLPFSTSYVDDYKNQLLHVYFSKVSRRDYYVSKLVAAFAGTAFIIAVSFLTNLLLCNCFFPHNGNTWIGEYQMPNFYRGLLGTNIDYDTPYPSIPFLRVYLFSPFLYNLIYILLFSSFSGLMSSFIMSLSFWLKKNKIILFAPVFIMTQLLRVIDAQAFSKAIESRGFYINVNIFEYFSPLFSKGLVPFFLPSIFILLFAIMICLTIFAINQDIRSLQ